MSKGGRRERERQIKKQTLDDREPTSPLITIGSLYSDITQRLGEERWIYIMVK